MRARMITQRGARARGAGRSPSRSSRPLSECAPIHRAPVLTAIQIRAGSAHGRRLRVRPPRQDGPHHRRALRQRAHLAVRPRLPPLTRASESDPHTDSQTPPETRQACTSSSGTTRPSTTRSRASGSRTTSPTCPCAGPSPRTGNGARPPRCRSARRWCGSASPARPRSPRASSRSGWCSTRRRSRWRRARRVGGTRRTGRARWRTLSRRMRRVRRWAMGMRCGTRRVWLIRRRHEWLCQNYLVGYLIAQRLDFVN